MRIVLRSVCFVCALAMAVPGFNMNAGAEQVVRFGIPEESYPPYLMHGDTGRHGIVGDVFVAVMGAMDRPYEIVVLPEKRMLFKAQNGELDAVAAAQEWGNSPGATYWSEGIISVSDNVVTQKGRTEAISTPEGLSGKTAVLMHGYVYPSLEAKIKSGNISSTRVTRFAQLLRMVESGRVEYGVLDLNVAQWVIREQKLAFAKGLAFSQPGFDEVSYRIALYPTGDWAPFVVKFNAALARLKASHAWNEILDRYR